MTMTDDPAERFFRVVVEPTAMEYLSRPFDFRLGCLVVLVLWSMVDHHFEACDPGPGEGQDSRGRHDSRRAEWREAFKQRGPAFGIICDVAEATKHMAPRQNGLGLAFSQLQPQILPPGGYGIGQIGYSVAGAYGRGDIAVLMGDGSEQPLDPSIRVVFDYWCSVFAP